MVATKIEVVDPVDMVEPWVEAEVEVVEARVDVRGLLDNTPLPVAVMFTFETKFRFYKSLHVVLTICRARVCHPQPAKSSQLKCATNFQSF